MSSLLYYLLLSEISRRRGIRVHLEETSLFSPNRNPFVKTSATALPQGYPQPPCFPSSSLARILTDTVELSVVAADRSVPLALSGGT